VSQRPYRLAVIPARFASTRFPGKPLTPLLGKPMVQHVHERCLEAGVFDRIVVATDDARIADAVAAFGGEARLTSPDCQSGTDRAAEVVRAPEFADVEVVVNVQGDEPAVHPEALATLAEAMNPHTVQLATLVRPLLEHERSDPAVVKAVVAFDGHALYFSRADLPFERSPVPSLTRLAHVGLYGFRRRALESMSAWPPSPLELTEGLEQLRALENGLRILCKVTTHTNASVDRPQDIQAAEALLKKRQGFS
jgi:3-deoxy-manno-octulosonate cytidylyltransferase (CMP-KDO synthetase)